MIVLFNLILFFNSFKVCFGFILSLVVVLVFIGLGFF